MIPPAWINCFFPLKKPALETLLQNTVVSGESAMIREILSSSNDSLKEGWEYMSRETLAHLLLAEDITPRKDYLVVDVRDEDFQDYGHIPSAINLPSSEFPDRLHGLFLAVQAQRIPIVVFHCMFSMSRGPRIASLFARYVDKVKAMDESLSWPLEIYVLRRGIGTWYKHYQGNPKLVQQH